MRREIKFRAWNTDFKEPTMEYFTLMEAMFSGNTFRLHDKEIMQYTGLKDCNGVEIYEGDIVKSYQAAYKEVAIIERDGVSYCLKSLSGLEHTTWRKFEKGSLHQILDYYTFEVIGNRYENPELLK